MAKPKPRKPPKPPTPPKPKPIYSLPPPNDDILEWGGTLKNLRRSKPDHHGRPAPCQPVVDMLEGPLGARYQWVEADLFEALLDEDAVVQGTIFQFLRRLDGEKPPDKAQLLQAIRSVFLDQYLPKLQAYFEAGLPVLADYVLAKAAYARVVPALPPTLPESRQ